MQIQSVSKSRANDGATSPRNSGRPDVIITGWVLRAKTSYDYEAHPCGGLKKSKFDHLEFFIHFLIAEWACLESIVYDVLCML